MQLVMFVWMFYICLQWKGWHQQMQHPLYIKRWYMNKMNLCHQLPSQWVQPPIGLKWAFNFDLEATWQLFIPQVWANQNLQYHFYHILDYWGLFYFIMLMIAWLQCENVICFKNYLVKKTFEYQNAISKYYGWQQVLHLFF